MIVLPLGAALVVGLFAGAAALVGRWEVWQAEGFKDRRLAQPTPSECAIVRVILADSRDHDRAALMHLVGDPDAPMELLAFAWASTGDRVGRGADWRGCPGLAAYVRSLGMAHLNSGGLGPALYVSRAGAEDSQVRVFETFYPPRRLAGRDVERKFSGAMRSWEIRLRRGSGDGRWVIADRRDAAPPEGPAPH